VAQIAFKQPEIGDIVLFVLPNGKIRPFLVCYVFGDLNRAIGGAVFAYPPEDQTAIVGIARSDYDDLKRPGSWHWKETKGTLTLVQ
jgi:hypothetical protein